MSNNRKIDKLELVEAVASNNAWWAPIVHFATHAFIASAVFVILGLATLGVGDFVAFLKVHGASEFSIFVFTAVEHAMVLLDAAVFMGYLAKASFKAFKEF